MYSPTVSGGCKEFHLLVEDCWAVSDKRVSGKSFNVSIGGMALSQVDSVRYLGVIIDPTLSWSLHITNIASRARSRLSSIFRYGTLTPAVLCLLYSAFVLPLFDYCDVVWCPTTAKFTALIERTHSKFMKKIASIVPEQVFLYFGGTS